MPAKYQIKKAKDGQFHFNLLATNGQVILSSEMYRSKPSAKKGIASVQKNAADPARFDRRDSKNGKPYFVLKARNSQIIGQSEIYETAAARENGIRSVKKNGATEKIEDLS